MSKPLVSQVHCAFATSNHILSLTIYLIKLKPTYTPSLKQPLRVILPTHPLQEPPISPAITFKRSLPVRAIVQVPVSMPRFISRCNGIDPLDGMARRRLNEFVIPAFVPVNREAYDNESLMDVVVQA